METTLYLPAPLPAVAYRAGIAAADVVALPGTVTCTLIAGGGATAGTYTIFVVAGTPHGRTLAKQGNATVTTAAGNLTARAAFAQVTGAVFYDIYCSVDGAASKFLARVTEAQRAAGCIVTASNTVGNGGTPGAVDCAFPGVGLAVNAGQLAVSTAYLTPADAPISLNGRQYVDFALQMIRLGDLTAAPSLTVLPLYWNAALSAWFAPPAPTVITFGGGAGNYQSLQQFLRLEGRGSLMHLIVTAIAGGTLSIGAIAN